jgi:hypothetical protein
MIMGIADENTSFPAVLSCPFCGKSTLYCYDDTAREDIWLACDTCSVHGNIITFAAQIWKLNPTQALTRFDENGLCSRKNDTEEVNRLAKIIERTTAAEKFWAAARKQLWDHDDITITYKLRELGVSNEIPCEGLVGVAHPKQVDELCGLVARVFPANLARKPVIVLPHYDLPQRFSGFLLLQPGEDLTMQRAFITTSRSGRIKTDAGYYLLQTALLPENPALKHSYFIVDDPLWALKAQTTQLRHGQSLLPICASYDGKEAASYSTNLTLFPHTRRFFSGRTVTPALISQAAAARGYVCTPPDRKSPLPDMPVKTVGRLANICRYAKTWQDALEQVFKTNNGLAAQAFAADLNIDRDKLHRFLQDRTPLSHDAIQRVLEKVVPHHGVDHIKYRPKAVIERDNKWYTTTGEQITNCTPIVTKIIYTDTEDKYYEGYIQKEDSAYPFFERSTVVERLGLLSYVSQHMATHGELALFTRQWNLRSLSTALTLHPPQILSISSAPGWNEKTKEFQFRRYSIKADGTVVPAPCPDLCTANPLDMPPPELAAPHAIHSLMAPTHENAGLWAFTAAVLTGMVAPAVAASPQSFVLEKNVFDTFSVFAAQFGCNSALLGAPYRNNSLGISQAVQLIRWPTLVSEINDNDKGLNASIIKHAHSQTMFSVLPQSIVSALSFDWYGINPAALPDKTTDVSPMRFVIPAYIQHVLRDRLPVKVGVPLVLIILRDLHKWLENTYGASFNLAAAERVIITPENAHVVLMTELNIAITAGDIAVLPRPRTSKQNQSYVIRNRQHWWLNRKAINNYLEQKSGIVPNWNALLNCFVKQGVFAGESTINKLNGLLLRRDWCDTFREPGSETQDVKNVG